MIAFDKNSSASFSLKLGADTKQEADEQFKEFESQVPFTRWFYEVTLDSEVVPETEDILQDIDWDY